MGMMKKLWEEHDRLMDLAEEMCERHDGERWPRPLAENKVMFMAVIEAAGLLQKVAGRDEHGLDSEVLEAMRGMGGKSESQCDDG